MTVGDRLNELLEAERAGVETLSRLVPEARSREHSSRRSGTTRRAGSCTRLARSIKFLGGHVRERAISPTSKPANALRPAVAEAGEMVEFRCARGP